MRDDTWILVADHARARLFRLHGGRQLEELRDFIDTEPARGDRAPRAHNGHPPGHGAVDPRAPHRDDGAAAFADLLAGILHQGRAMHRYRHLVLVAPPPFLGELRGALARDVHACVVSEIARQTTMAPPHVVLDALPPRLPGEAARHGRPGVPHP